MKFRIGNRVKIRDKTLAKMAPRFAVRLKGRGGVEVEGVRYTKVTFSDSNIGYWLSNQSLELIKNQQLLFSFMEKK